MIIVIIAGGSGTRLWPLSQANYPKHLLALTGPKSLLQNTYARASSLTKQIYVVTEVSHAAEIKKQLPALGANNVIIEPARRGTASCIMLALSRLKGHVQNDEPIIFLHADHHISDSAGFATTVKAAAEAATKHHKITLIGLKPDYPATGFGYIKLAGEADNISQLPIYKVEQFVEKPELATAERYVKSGQYLWNLGLFAAPLSVFEVNFKQFAPEMWQGYEALCAAKTEQAQTEVYLGLANQAIDTALIEKSDQTLVVPGSFDWADIGSFFDLHKILQGEGKNALKGEVHQIDCDDCMIHAAGKPILALGLSGVVVVDTPEGLLVCSKEQSQRVKEVLEVYEQSKQPKG